MFVAPKVEGWDMVKIASHSFEDLDWGYLCLQEYQRGARHSMVTTTESSKHLQPLSLGVETAFCCYITTSISEFFKAPHIYEYSYYYHILFRRLSSMNYLFVKKIKRHYCLT